MNYWLIKSEPDCYGIDDLIKDRVEHWDGVRNYQARNFLRDGMKNGDLCIFYHSNCKPPHAAGTCKVVKEGYVDHTAFIPSEKHFDPKSDPEKPRWFMVDVEFESRFEKIVPLEDMKQNPALSEMKLVQKGNRLSVMPIKKEEFYEICSMAEQ